MEDFKVCEMLHNRRNELSLSQRQVADFVGVTEATVSRWESGEISNMRRDKVAKLAQILQVSPLFIMGIDLKDGANKSVPLYSNEESQLLNGYRKLSDDGKNLILSMIEQLSFSRSNNDGIVNVGNANFLVNGSNNRVSGVAM